MVDSDRTCPECKAGSGAVLPTITLTYNFPDKHLGGVTYGGYSETIVVDRALCCTCPRTSSRRDRPPTLRRNHDVLADAPLGRCQGKKVGIVGLGGLGHMGVKFAHALGAHVVVFTTSPRKKDDAQRLGGRRRDIE